MNKEHAFVLLGSLNDSNGKLSTIALERCNKLIECYNEGEKVIVTGGFGKHFNESSLPHWRHSSAYLISKGIREKDIIARVNSSNTIEDAKLLHKETCISVFDHLTIITSDFHADRSKLIFKSIFYNLNIDILTAKTNIDDDDFKKLLNHEKEAIKRLNSNKDWLEN